MILGRLVVYGLSSSSLVKGVAIAIVVGAAVHGVGLALDRHGPLCREGDGQVLELVHDLTTADLLSNVLGPA